MSSLRCGLSIRLSYVHVVSSDSVLICPVFAINMQIWAFLTSFQVTFPTMTKSFPVVDLLCVYRDKKNIEYNLV